MTIEEMYRDLTVLRQNCKNIRGWDYTLLINQANRETTITPLLDPTLYMKNTDELNQILDLARILDKAKLEIDANLSLYPNTMTTKKILLD